MALSTDLLVGQQEVGGCSLSAGMMFHTANLGIGGIRKTVVFKLKNETPVLIHR